MKKILVVAVLALGIFSATAQDKKNAPKDGWKKGGTFTFLINQSAFSDWVAGGENTVAGNLGINYDFNLLKGDLTWDNKITLAYGISNTETNGTRKTDDRLEFNSLLGKKAKGFWYYSYFFDFKTQFTDGYDYKADPTASFPVSKLFAPAYITTGPGMLWKKSDNLKVNISPAAAKIVYVGDTTLSNLGAYGVNPGEKTRFELGFSLGAYYKTELAKNVTMENTLKLYSNYLDKPQNMDVDYLLNFVMPINKHMNTTLSFHALYDDNAFQGLQLMEVFGLGFNYNF
jgi:hypothetical protein